EGGLIMGHLSWLRGWTSAEPTPARPARGQPSRPRPAGRRLLVEQLEDRVVPSTARGDFLYVGDGGDNTVKQFDATTGALVGDLVASGSQGMLGPRGLLFRNPGQLLAVNQNVGTTIPGEVLRYNGVTGVPLGSTVSA